MTGLLGPRDEFLRTIEKAFPDVAIRVQGNQISVSGVHPAPVLRLFDELVLLLESGQSLDTPKILRTVDMVNQDLRPSEVLRHEVMRGPKGKSIRPSTAGQKRYADAIATSTITFGIGPAGTGKSSLAVAAAVQALAVGGRGFAGNAAEDPVELRERLEAGLVGGLADPRVRVQQQMLGVLDAGPRNVVREGEPGRRLEDLAEIERAHVGRPRHLLQTQRLGEMLTDERAGLRHRRRLSGGRFDHQLVADHREVLRETAQQPQHGLRGLQLGRPGRPPEPALPRALRL